MNSGKIYRDWSVPKFSPAVVINTYLYIIKILYYFDTNNVVLADFSLIDIPLNYQVPGILCECPTSVSVGDRPAIRVNVSLLFWLDRFVSGVNILGTLTRYAKLPGMFSLPLLVSMSGSLISGFLWSRWRGKRSLHSRCMRNTQCCVSGNTSEIGI